MAIVTRSEDLPELVQRRVPWVEVLSMGGILSLIDGWLLGRHPSQPGLQARNHRP
jgi:hypothetical protein